MTIVANKIVVEAQFKDSISKEFTRLIDRMGSQVDGLHSRFERAGLGRSGFNKIPKIFGFGTVISVILGVVESLKGFDELDRQIQSMNRGFQNKLTGNELNDFVKRLQVIRAQTGVSLEQSGKVVKSAQGFGFNTKDSALEILKQGSILGVGAGASDLFQSGQLLAKTLAGFQRPAEEAVAAVGVIFRMVRDGNTTITTLNESLEGVFPSAQRANISLEQLAGGFISLRRADVSARDAGLALEKLSELISDTKLKATLEFLGADGKSLAQGLEKARKAANPLKNSFFALQSIRLDQLEKIFGKSINVAKIVDTLRNRVGSLDIHTPDKAVARGELRGAFLKNLDSGGFFGPRAMEVVEVFKELVGEGLKGRVPGSQSDKFDPRLKLHLKLDKTGEDVTDSLIQGIQTPLISSRGEIGNFFSTNLSAILNPVESGGGLNPSLWGGNVSTAYADGFIQKLPLLTAAAGQVSTAWDEGLVAVSARIEWMRLRPQIIKDTMNAGAIAVRKGGRYSEIIRGR